MASSSACVGRVERSNHEARLVQKRRKRPVVGDAFQASTSGTGDPAPSRRSRGDRGVPGRSPRASHQEFRSSIASILASQASIPPSGWATACRKSLGSLASSSATGNSRVGHVDLCLNGPSLTSQNYSKTGCLRGRGNPLKRIAPLERSCRATTSSKPAMSAVMSCGFGSRTARQVK